MQVQISDRAELSRWMVIAVDILLVNIAFVLGSHFGMKPTTHMAQMLWNMAYLISVILNAPIAQNRFVKAEQIISKSIVTALQMAISYAVLISLARLYDFHWSILAVNILVLILTISLSRVVSRLLLRATRRRGKDRRTVVFAGAGVNLRALYDRMALDLSTGYNVKGYFEDKPSTHLPETLQRLGTVSQVTDYLDNNHVDMLFCNLPSSRSEEILQIMNYCENHLIRFYSVPNVRNYVHRAMTVEYVDDVPVLTLRSEPLLNPFNRITKRLFDVIVSLTFLVTCFWWVAAIVALITKITMPGPVFFRQKRNGINGDEFTCLKFRSMRVNADADKVQATKDDPRKTKWGNIMRKTNIDELPQFINVLLGDMSIVGPRPHMVKHTEEYGALVDKYMVRHYTKPGITGWAQVTGSRGETSELWMMEERIKKDIWYVENWSLLLDIKIIIKTVTNVFGGEKGNAY